MQVTVLLSGGIDSAALLEFYLRQQLKVRAVFVNFGQPAAKQEACAARAICDHYGVRLSVIAVKFDNDFFSGEITGRNAFLVFGAILTIGMQPGIISIGIHKGTPYYDCSDSFLKSIQNLVDGYAAGRIAIAAPFLDWTKPLILSFCRHVGVPFDLTYSCEMGGEHPCGRCLSCKDREALCAP